MEPVIEFTRQEDLIPAQALNDMKLTIIGAGAIGSFTSLTLAKMGVSDITVFDNDIIEPHNLPNQFYRVGDIDSPKVEALKNIIALYAAIDIDARKEEYVNGPLEGTVISCVDSMVTRHDIWEKIVANSAVHTYIDSRMGAEVAELYTVTPGVDNYYYEQYLYPEEEVIEAPCTAKATVYTAAGISALVCGKIKKLATKQPYNKRIVVDFTSGMLIRQKGLEEGIPS
jgi:molybdopterin/thiamine biosynthesis adenylyltransferase